MWGLENEAGLLQSELHNSNWTSAELLSSAGIPAGITNPDPSTAFPAHCVLNRNPFSKPRVSAINEESPSMVGAFVLKYLFSKRTKHPSKEGDLQGPWCLLLEWNGSGEKARSQGSLTPWDGPQAHHKFVFVKPNWFWHLRCSGDGLCTLCGGWGSFPGLGWRGRLKTRLQKALENLQICKSPQAVHELVPTRCRRKRSSCCPGSCSSPASGTKLRPGSPPFSCRCVLHMERELQNFLQDAPLWGSTESWSSCSSQASSCCAPSASEQDQVWGIHPELWDCTDFHLFLGNCSIGITQCCWSCLLGSGVIKMIN